MRTLIYMNQKRYKFSDVEARASILSNINPPGGGGRVIKGIAQRDKSSIMVTCVGNNTARHIVTIVPLSFG